MICYIMIYNKSIISLKNILTVAQTELSPHTVAGYTSDIFLYSSTILNVSYRTNEETL